MGERVLTREDTKSFIRTNTEKLRLPSDFTVIGEGSLAGFSQVKELIIPEGVKKIASHAFFIRSFKNTSSLERLTIPSTLTDFDLWAFYDCDMLKTINLPEDFPEEKAMELFFLMPAATLNFGKKMLFAAKSKTVQQIIDETHGILTSGQAMLLPVENGVLTIPATFFAIVPHALRSLANKGVHKVVLPKSIRVIAPFVFADLPELEEIVVEDGTTHLDNYAFSRCKMLKAVELPDSITRIGAGLFMEDRALRCVKLPEHLTAVPEEIFSLCTELQSIGFGHKVKKIGAGAFNGCTALQSLMLPEGVETIGISAFWECTALHRLYLPPSTKTISPSALGNCPSLSVLYMPDIIGDALESKRIFGENTNPATIQTITAGFDRSVFETEAIELEHDIPEVPTVLPNVTASQIDTQPKADAETVRKLEETIAAMQQQIANLSQRTAVQASPVSDSSQPSIDANTIQTLNDNFAAMRGQLDAVSEMRSSVESIAAMQSRVEEIAEMQATVQQKVDAISDLSQGSDVISDMRKKIDVIADIQEKVNAMTEMQEKVDVIPELREKVEAISSLQHDSEAISDMREKMDALSDIQEKVEVIPELQEKVEAIAQIQQTVDSIARTQEAAVETSEVQKNTEANSQKHTDASVVASVPFQDPLSSSAPPSFKAEAASVPIPAVPDELPATPLTALDANMAIVACHTGEYAPQERVFTHEISKTIAGPKERSALLKDYTVIASRAFWESEGGERFQIPEGIRRIESQAFWNCPRLLALELPKSLKEVEPDAFAGCTRLTDVYLCDDFPERRAAEYFLFRPEVKLHWPKKGLLSRAKVVSVAELLEKYDDILTAEKAAKLIVRNHILQIPKGYTIIAPEFAKSINLRVDEPEHTLKTIFLPNTIRRIAAHAFVGLESVMHIVIPDGLQMVDMNAFAGCMGPYRLVLPDTVCYIGPYAFAAPSRYEQIRLPKTIRSISGNAFSNCNTLTSLRFAASVEEIGACALSGCTMLASLTIPKRFSDDLPSILDGPVKINVRWTEEVESYCETPSNELLSVIAPSFPAAAPQRVFTQAMSREAENFAERLSLLYQHPYIGALALTDMANQTKFEIPLGVQRICTNAFGQNNRLLTLTIPKALTEFEYEAFRGCTRLRDVFVPEEFDRYAAAVLFMRNPLILITIGNARALRVRQLLNECPWILSTSDAAELDVEHETMTVPEGYMVIASYVYHGILGKINLKRFQISPDVRLIGSHAFVQLKELEEIICAEGLRAVESEAFVECPALRRVVFPSTLQYLGSNILVNCPNLETVTLPKTCSQTADALLRVYPNLTIEWCEDAPASIEAAEVSAIADEMQPQTILSNPRETPIPSEEVEHESIPGTVQDEHMTSEFDAIDHIESDVLQSVTLKEHSIEGTLSATEAEATAGVDSSLPAQSPMEVSLQGMELSTTEKSVDGSDDTEPVLPEIIDHMNTDDTQPEFAALADELLTDIDKKVLPTASELQLKAARDVVLDEISENVALEASESTLVRPTGVTLEAQIDDSAGDEPYHNDMDALANALFENLSPHEAAVAQKDTSTSETVREANELQEMSASVTNAPAKLEEALESEREIPQEKLDSTEHEAQKDAEIDSVADTLFSEAPLLQAEIPASEPEERKVEDVAELAEEMFLKLAETLDGLEPVPAEPKGNELAEALETTDALETSSDSEELETIAETLFTPPEVGANIPAEESATEDEIPADGRFTAKERRRWYHGELAFTVPNGYREIRAGACAALEHLEVLTLSSTIAKIGNGAFADCTALRIVQIPLSVTEIAQDAFDECNAITEVTIPSRFAKQAISIFPENTQFNLLDEPPKIIGDGKFTAKIRAKLYEDTPLFEIPEGYLEVRAGACAGLEELVELRLPRTLKSIRAGAFSDCTALQTVVIPPGVQELAEDAFEGCSALQTVIVPRHLEAAAKLCFPNVMLQIAQEQA